LSTRFATFARVVYVALPLPERYKLPLKDAVYASLGGVFRDSPRYMAWRESRGGPLPAQPEQPGRVFATTSRAPVVLDSLPVADGSWEWADYEPVKQRIEKAKRDSAHRAHPKKRPIIDLGAEDPAAAARRIELPAAGDTPDISVIVPVYGHLKLTVECLLSIAAAGKGKHTFEVLVADDASPDDTYESLKDVPNLRVVRQETNQGFLRNCNAASREARGRLLVFLNNDAQVTPGWLDALARVFDEESNVGAAGPKIVYPSGHLQDAGSRIRREGSVEMIGLNGSPDDKRWSYRRDVDYVSGACLMIPADLFRDLGGFDDTLAPAYCEDLELGIRLHERGLRSVYVPDAEIVHHLSATSDSSSSTYKIRQINRNMQKLAERYQERLDEMDDIRVIAMYLPQFHPFEQNDLWWGAGFTEWTNVVGARPNFVGQYQPRQPADLGFYDLRVTEVLDKQWDLAEAYGVDAFCYYYYWFDGKRLLDRPLERLRNPEQRSYPFCLCWANENWTRRWDGKDNDILIGQRHTPEDDLAVIRDLATYMWNPAYIRIKGRPLVLVYRVDLFPDFKATSDIWRAEARRMGLGDLHIALVESFRFAAAGVDPAEFGCDAVVEFPAHFIPDMKPPTAQVLNPDFAGMVADYADAVISRAARTHPGHKLYRGVMPGWDNTARRQNQPYALHNATPGAFQAWLESVIAETKRDLHGDERLVFINAWNEWAEGAYLEPDRRFGHTYLEAIRNARDAERYVARPG
jgi:GT2 family glycosyltransferase